MHKAILQPEDDHSPGQVAVGEIMIQLDDGRYRPYAVIDPETRELLHTKLDPTRTDVLADAFFTELREKRDIDYAVYFADGATPLKTPTPVIGPIPATSAREAEPASNTYLCW